MAKPGFYDRYTPGRRDARIVEARVMLKMRHDLAGLRESTFAASYNLKPETAATLIAEEGECRARVR